MSHTSFEAVAARRRDGLDEADRVDYDAQPAALAAALRAGITVRDAREQAGLTQTELAARMGVSQSALARIESPRPPAPVGDRELIWPDLAPQYSAMPIEGRGTTRMGRSMSNIDQGLVVYYEAFELPEADWNRLSASQIDSAQ